MTYLQQFFSNRLIGVSALAWLIAQLIKIIIDLVKNKTIDIRLITSSGGMPSSHSSFVTSLATSVGLTNGFDSVDFAITFVLCMVVMYDAAGVRRAAGKQAAVINDIAAIMENYGFRMDENLKELLGHTPVEVTAGAILGIGLSIVMNLFVFR
ncbi:MAG: divergent PAP2 family protein [Firmicutes bacterium]|nr:divergent PAP2 family protein [Bacillota bacterium]